MEESNHNIILVIVQSIVNEELSAHCQASTTLWSHFAQSELNCMYSEGSNYSSSYTVYKESSHI